MNILKEIIKNTKQEVALKKRVIAVAQLKSSDLFTRQPYSLSKSLTSSGNGIIAEHKRRSPSKSVINESANVTDVITGYNQADVGGISVLTDTKFFGGSLNDLLVAREATSKPILRKEFIVDIYQIYEAKAYGADAILLIAGVLSKLQIEEFSKVAQDIGLEVLVEIHNHEELQKTLIPSVQLIGVNNRNLTTFQVSLKTSKNLAAQIPSEFVKISESGINAPEAILTLREYGFQGFLVGEHFMKTDNPGDSAFNFIKQLK